MKKTFLPQGSYMIMLFDENHDRQQYLRCDGNMEQAIALAEEQLRTSPSLYHSYAIARVIRNSLVTKWSTQAHEPI